MAIAMEVGWPASDLGGDSYPALIGKKRGWGDDQQKLLQLMMGPSSKEDTRITLDLLGGSSSASQQSQFLDLNPDVPLPSGWEKCLDLKSGSIYFVNWNTGITTTVDPRNSQFPLSKSSPSAATSHEFLHTMQSATLKLINPSSELKCEEDAKPWKEKLRFSDLMKKPLESGDLELNLNLSMTNESDMSVCTVEKVQRALARSVMRRTLHPPSSSSRSVPASASEARSWISQPATSPATSTSSSSSSGLSAKRLKSEKAENKKATDRTQSLGAAIADKGKETKKGSVILTGCKRCLTYVMLSASDPVCPRCGTTVICNLSFSPTKNTKVELKL
ncbi:hypothetical protein O6H91_13G032500 [Diphasiastrum complanatum]|uniref:Uncharacterized protein n=2 Tax=Diphasiastrum complanatum TaxID=34168 RepID=A0ACC2BTI9_DIPCM|nr:hypothetical protein O6H91_13G032300 [Diphasiastrum complanatum]KAJ7533082.1 hypothetical protein O6H91_13G032500 [Diphasiastrum complanatum]